MSETAGSRLARLLALVPWLRLNDGVSISEAARHFQVSDEQLTTDLWQLIVCGIPGYGPDQLVDIQFWDDDRIHVLDPIALDRPLRLTAEEAASLVVAMRVLAQIPGDHDRDALRSAMAKLHSAASPASTMDVQIDADPRIVEEISQAITSAHGLDIEYAAASADAITRRRIAPRASYTVEGWLYVEAWCELAQDWRTFRVDRIVSAHPATVDPPSDSAAPTRRAGSAAGPGLPSGAPTARIAVAPQAAWIWDIDPVVPDGQSWSNHNAPAVPWPTGTLAYASEGFLVRYIVGRGGQVVLVAPEELRAKVTKAARAKVERLHAGSQGSG